MNINKIVRIAAIFLLLYGTVGCKQGAKSMLAKKWKVVSFETMIPIPDSARQKMIDENWLEFTTNGKYTSYSLDKEIETGEYELVDDDKTMKIKTGGREQTISIITLEKNKLVGKQGNNTVTFQPK